jgi:NAD+ synthetase
MDPRIQDAPLSVGLIQFKPVKADVGANLGRIQDLVQGHSGQQDLLVFPETAASGYFLEGGVAEVALSAEELAAGLGASGADGPDVVIGFYERWRRRLYNSVAYLAPRGGGWVPVHVHRKMFLPTYGVFQEARFVEAGTALEAFDTRLGRVGMLVCEEMWHSLPPTVLALDGAELIVCVSASPARDFRVGGRPGSVVRWEGLARSVAEEHGVFVAVSQLVGSEGGKLFPGCSMVFGPDGKELVRGPFLDEGVATASLEGAQLDRARGGSPLLADLEQMLPHLQEALERTRRGRPLAPDERPVEAGGGLRGLRTDRQPGCMPKPGDTSFLELDWTSVEEALLAFIREEVIRRRGFERLVLGASGGVDSSVSLYLAARALGPENVVAFRLPYASSSQESLDHAQKVIEATGVRSHTIEITPAVDAYVEAYEPDITPLRRGNLAARFRAVTLFDQSAKLGPLPLGTGNKSERLLGYFTWHADDSPPINPLGDLLKTQVWGLARHLGVPDVIVEKPASADLVRGVHDEDELGISYNRADPLLHWFLEGYRPDELIGHGFDEARVWLVWGRLNSTHWKRELPTVAMLTSSAIGEFYLRPVDY